MGDDTKIIARTLATLASAARADASAAGILRDIWPSIWPMPVRARRHPTPERCKTPAEWVAEAISGAPEIEEHLPETTPPRARVLHVMCEMMKAFGDDPDAWGNVPAEAAGGGLSKKQLAAQVGRSPETVKRYVTDARNVAAQMSAKLRKRLRKTRPEPPM
jgi:hypothetical protein